MGRLNAIPMLSDRAKEPLTHPTMLNGAPRLALELYISLRLFFLLSVFYRMWWGIYLTCHDMQLASPSGHYTITHVLKQLFTNGGLHEKFRLHAVI